MVTPTFSSVREASVPIGRTYVGADPHPSPFWSYVALLTRPATIRTIHAPWVPTRTPMARPYTVFLSYRTPRQEQTGRQSESFDFKVDHADGIWIVEDDASGVFGSGETPLEAMRDFRQAVVDHVDVLSRQDELSPGLEEQLDYLLRRL